MDERYACMPLSLWCHKTSLYNLFTEMQGLGLTVRFAELVSSRKKLIIIYFSTHFIENGTNVAATCFMHTHREHLLTS